MSDREVVLALDAVEHLLHTGDLASGTLAAWQERFDAAMATAERGPGWAMIAQRSHLLGRRMDLALAGVLAERDAIGRELRLLARGGRALKGYKPAQS
jgi:hypothetical protein